MKSKNKQIKYTVKSLKSSPLKKYIFCWMFESPSDCL